MDQNEEYHDPDYPEAPRGAHQGPTSGSEEDKMQKIRKIICREFSHELEARENDILTLDQRSLLARRMLHRLRYTLVNNYYNEERLKLSSAQIQDEVTAQAEPTAQASVSNLLCKVQRRLHPSVRKLLGKQSSNVELHEILFRRRAPRNKTRKDYSVMAQVKKTNIDICNQNSSGSNLPDVLNSQAAAGPQSIGPNGPKMPRSLLPEVKNVLTVNDPARNQTKHRYRIIIGNTSKYAPPASAADKSTHKWLLYVRGPPSCPTLGILKGVTVRLHHSYAPHHTLHIDKPPFHISRRGWGEFPAKVELHFSLPERNRPVTVEHTIKLDRQYTGFQTLGGETIVDVWLYSTEEMLQYEFKEEDHVVRTDSNNQINKEQNPIAEVKQEIVENEVNNDNINFENNTTENHTDNWLDFFSNETELDVDEMIIKPQKKIDDRPDLDSMIESTVIPKDNTENMIDFNATKIKQEVIEDDFKIKTEPQDDDTVQNSINTKIDYTFKKEIEDIPNELLSQTTSPKKRIMKYMDPTTGKIYYLEMDRKLDLSKVQEIVINSKGNIKTAKISPIKPNGLKNVRKNTKKGGVSLLKPEVKSLLKNENTKVQNIPKVSKQALSHIENDHCYINPAPLKDTEQIINNLNLNFEEPVNIKKEKSVYETVLAGVKRVNSVRVAVDLCLRKVPLLSSEARDPDYVKHFPFVVETEEKYWKLDFAKRRNLEWTRAKFINKLLTENLNTTEAIWRTKQILIYSRMHGYYPVRPEIQRSTISEPDWSSWIALENQKTETDIRELYPNASDISTLTMFDENNFSQNLSETIELIESDEEVEILNCDEKVKVKKEVLPDLSAELPVLPVQDPQERLRFIYLEKKCSDIGIELRNEDVGSGYSYSCVHAVLLSAMKSFASDLIRSSLAEKQTDSDGTSTCVWQRSTSRRTNLTLLDIWRGANSDPRLHALTSRGLGTQTHKPEGL